MKSTFAQRLETRDDRNLRRIDAGLHPLSAYADRPKVIACTASAMLNDVAPEPLRPTPLVKTEVSK